MKPEPIVVRTLCSLCDLDWEPHGDEPTTADCIRLLKIELSRRPLNLYWNTPRPWWATSYSSHPSFHLTSVGTNTSSNGITLADVTDASAFPTRSDVQYRTPDDAG